jgi:hypothetical protein
MSALHQIGGGAKALPFDLALSVIPSLPRPLLARFVARAIERMDAEDGDPDLEPDDPPEDGHDAEAETWPTRGAQWELTG